MTPGFIRDAGMLHESGAKLPPGVGTSSPEEVAAAVLRNIERDPGEIVVAPRALRAGAAFASLLPNVSATVSRKLGVPEDRRRDLLGPDRQALGGRVNQV